MGKYELIKTIVAVHQANLSSDEYDEERIGFDWDTLAEYDREELVRTLNDTVSGYINKGVVK